MSQRSNQILELLIQNNRMEVSALSDQLGVSQVTIRKDLDQLESQGMIHREHGFAVLASMDDINGRIAYHYEEKKLIAAKAMELVQDGDTIMIESGSCCALLAELLTKHRRDLTIITNSAFIVEYIRNQSNFQIILLGGIYQAEARVNVGPMVRQCAENFYVKHFFIGTDGYSTRTGFTNKDQMRAQAVRDMAQQAENIIVLTESEKFERIGTVPLNIKDNLKMVITDEHIPLSVQEELQSAGIQIL